MLAIRLHKTKRPALNKYTFLIPILSWETGKVQIKNWICILNNYNEGNPNSVIRYITLVTIPKDHPVFILTDWICKHGCEIKNLDYKPLNEHDEETLNRIMQWDLISKTPDNNIFNESGPNCRTPELILGMALPKSCIKWTKDINFLYSGNKKKTE